jgi:hypothetical protein
MKTDRAAFVAVIEKGHGPFLALAERPFRFA